MTIMTAETLKQRKDRKDDFVLINILPEEQFESEHIPGSHNVPATSTDFVKQVENLAGSKSRPVVLYGTGTESQSTPPVTRKLTEAGFTNVSHFAGGMKAWRQAGYEVEAARTTAAR